jgi:hypothetical protein
MGLVASKVTVAFILVLTKPGLNNFTLSGTRAENQVGILPVNPRIGGGNGHHQYDQAS